MSVEEVQAKVTFLDVVRKATQENKERFIEKHYGPGPHRGTGTSQSIHGGARQRKGAPKEAALPKGTKIRWDAGLKANARAMPDNSVHVGPKFFSEVPREDRGSILAHEYGHVLEQMAGAIKSGTTFDRAMSVLEDKKHSKPGFWWGHGGGYNVMEAWANAFRDYAMSETKLKKQNPKVYAYIDSFARKHPEFAKTDYDAIAAQLKPGPKGSRLTIFDKTQG